MNIDNITSDGIALTNNGKEMLIKVYEQEIKRLKEEYVMLQNASDEVEEELQQRIDKAIEYIENNFISYEDSRTFGRLGEEIDIQVKEIRELFNILKGVDKKC